MGYTTVVKRQEKPAEQCTDGEKEEYVMAETPSNSLQGRPPEEIAAMEAEGNLRAKVYREAFRWSIVKSVRRNVPALVAFAREAVTEVQRIDALEELAMQVYEETDIARVSQLLAKAAYRGRWNIYSELDELFHESMLRREARFMKSDALREEAVDIIKKRFPTLVLLAKQYVECLSLHEVLEHIIKQLSDAPDEATARDILDIEGDKQKQRALVVECVRNRFPKLIEYAQQQVEQITSLHYLYCLRSFLEAVSNEDEATDRINTVARFEKRG